MLELISRELKIRNEILDYILENLQSYMYTASIIISETIKNGNTIFLFGNGRSVGIVENFKYDLQSIGKDVKVFSFSANSSEITDIADEFGYDRVYDKQVEWKAKKRDLLVGFSAVKHSKNILRALSLGRNIECKTIGFSGDDGIMEEFCDLTLSIPGQNENLLLEMYILMSHIILKNVKVMMN